MRLQYIVQLKFTVLIIILVFQPINRIPGIYYWFFLVEGTFVDFQVLFYI